MPRKEFMKPSNNLLFPKPGKKKKRKPKHRESILQDKDGRCFLCMLLDNNNFYYPDIEEHHVFEGPDRPISTEEGLTVYLCPRHHRTGDKSDCKKICSSNLGAKSHKGRILGEIPEELFMTDLAFWQIYHKYIKGTVAVRYPERSGLCNMKFK